MSEEFSRGRSNIRFPERTECLGQHDHWFALTAELLERLPVARDGIGLPLVADEES